MTSILIVEDDPMQAEALKLQLVECGYHVAATVSDGAEAVERAASLAPDVVLMDIVLPGRMDGIAAAQMIRASCNIPVLYLTAYADDEFFRRAKVTEPYAYLLKPSTAREIQLAIEIALYRHNIERMVRTSLEKTIQDRTADLQHAAKKLRITNADLEAANRHAERSELRYKTLIDQAADALFVFDLDGRFVEVNQHACDSLGYTSTELLRLSIPDVSPGHDLASRRLVWATFEIGKRYSVSATHRRKDGSIFPVDIHLAVMQVNGGKLFMALVTDTTEREQALQALRKSEQHLKQAQSIAHIGSWDYDLVTDQLTWSEELYRIYGVSPDTFIPDSENLIQLIHPDDRAAMREWMAACVTVKNPVTLKFRCVHPDEAIHFIEGQGELILDDHGKPVAISGTAQDINERKQAEDEIHNLAFFDSLTKLPNRRLLGDRLDKALAASKRSSHYGAVMFLDLDNFKPLNDKYGHGAGDLLLAEVAQRLTRCVREVDTVARFGGDEFVVVLSELYGDKTESTTQASIVADKIRTALSEPYYLAYSVAGTTKMIVNHRCAASIGVVLFNGTFGAEDLIKWADNAMYQAKEAGRNSVYFHEPKQ